MLMRCILPGFVPLLALVGLAATTQLPYLKVGPVTYSNVTVIGANTTDLYFRHDKGIGNVKLKYLSPELQKQFHYDPAKATDAERTQADADARYSTDVASDIATREQRTRAAAAAAKAARETLADPISDKSLLGKAAPPLVVDAWIGDKPELEGKYVLLAFWEPWSAPCLRCLPDLNVYQKLFANKLVVVGVSTNSEADISLTGTAKPLFSRAIDSKGKLSTTAGVTSIPAVLLIDSQGIVRYEGHPAALTESKLKGWLAQVPE